MSCNHPPHGTKQQMSYRLDIEYDGTDFLGWQIQRDGRTVQGELEKALETLFGGPTRVVAAGRTDAGVHAAGQVVHFHSERHRPVETVQRALNALLPEDIYVKGAALVSPDFHARFHAQWRRYKYLLAIRPSALWRRFSWCPHFDYDFDLVKKATVDVRGHQDFAAFRLTGSDTVRSVCEVLEARWVETEGLRIFDIVADRFLRGMVRLLVGTLLEIGRRRFEAGAIPIILKAGKSERAGPLAPPQGLTLVEVGYSPWRGFSRQDDGGESSTPSGTS
jgi:tRNA pseudouridine38-40 synthase